MEAQLRIFLLVGLLAFLANEVNCGCAERTGPDNDENSGNDDESSVSNFFSNIGCSIKSGAKKVKESVEDGYKFIKTKLSSSDEETQNTDKKEEQLESSHSMNAASNGQIVFEDDQIVSEVTPIQTESISENKTMVLDDRASLTAPENCADAGYLRTSEGNCVKQTNF